MVPTCGRLCAVVIRLTLNNRCQRGEPQEAGDEGCKTTTQDKDVRPSLLALRGAGADQESSTEAFQFTREPNVWMMRLDHRQRTPRPMFHRRMGERWQSPQSACLSQ